MKPLFRIMTLFLDAFSVSQAVTMMKKYWPH